LIDADSLPLKQEWINCKAIGRVIRERTKDGKTSREECYYITSLGLEIDKFSRAARGHWGVENELHWALDVIFDEDRHRFQSKCGAANLSLLRKIALAILSEDKTLKCGSPAKQMRAATFSSNREHLLKKCI
jgi:predicted transposase YbfD/YdcC